MRGKGELDDVAFFEFAKTGCHAEIVAALSLLSGAPLKLMEKLLQSEQLEAFLMPCKASDLEWPTARVILSCRAFGRAISAENLEPARTDYVKLSKSSARRVLRFWQVRQTAANDAAPVS
jgi:Uncharacterised protein conserved in bacteria (DUF2336)